MLHFLLEIDKGWSLTGNKERERRGERKKEKKKKKKIPLLPLEFPKRRWEVTPDLKDEFILLGLSRPIEEGLFINRQRVSVRITVSQSCEAACSVSVSVTVCM